MIDLLLAILFFNIILVLFKLFDRYKVDNLQAIVVNYVIAGSCGILFSKVDLTFTEIISFDWIYYAAVVGLFFIIVFNLLAIGTQKVGIAISTVANKMSLVLPVIASFFLYQDDISFLKLLGIFLALVGVVLSSTNAGKLSFDIKYLGLILIIFFGQGVADILFNYAQKTYVQADHGAVFISVLFISAFLSGIIILTIQVIRKKEQLKYKNIFWGIALGVPNFLTVYYFFRALESEFFQSSQAYPILNMGVIIISAITGLVFFKEQLSVRNWIGILISMLAIAAIGFS